ncbi:MAG: type II secretion system F family protein [Armatimonadota bacterium]
MARRFRRRQDPTLNRTRPGDVEPENPLYYLRRVSPGAKSFFFEQLSEMFDAGVTAYDALETISHQKIDGRVRSAVEKMVPEISEGASLADQMDRFPELFEPQIRGLIRAGEMSGRLAEITAFIAQELREKQKVSWKILLAQIWFTIPLVFIALVVPLPRIIDLGFEWYLNFILRVSIPIVLGLTVVYLIGKIVLNLRAVRPFRDRLMYGLPVAGKLVQQAALRRYLQALDALMASGVEIQEGMTLAAEAAGNAVLEKELKQVADRVRRGQPIGTALTKARSIPAQIRQTLATAERTGNYDRALDELQVWAKHDQSRITQMAAWGGYGVAMLVTAMAVAVAVYFGYKFYVEAIFNRAEEWMP